MPTIADVFTQMLEKNDPSDPEATNRRSHARTIRQALAAEFSSEPSVEVIGSHTRATAIRYFSDVDYLARLSSKDVTWGGNFVASTTTLQRTRKALETRFSNYGTIVRIDGPAVVVAFGQGEGAVDVVPAVYAGPVSDVDGYPRFWIPNGNGDWTATSPQRHGQYIKDENTRTTGKLSRVARMLKVWKYARSPAIPIHGFHLELLLASAGTCVGVRSYQNILLDAFRLLRDRRGAGLNDPLGISGRIDAVRGQPAAERLATGAAYASEHAEAAIHAELRRDSAEAIRQWNLVFNSRFTGR